MSAALSAGAINKLPDEDKPDFTKTRNGLMMVVMSGNLAALTLIGAMAYGFRTLDWWIPLSCMFVSFPIAHILIFQRLLGDLRALFLMMPCVLVSIGALYHFW